jgi:hypothetical protein
MIKLPVSLHAPITVVFLQANNTSKKSSSCISMMSIAIKFYWVVLTITAMLDFWMILWETLCLWTMLLCLRACHLSENWPI